MPSSKTSTSSPASDWGRAPCTARWHGSNAWLDFGSAAGRASSTVPSDGGRRHSASLGADELAKPGHDRIASAPGAGMKWLLWLYPPRWAVLTRRERSEREGWR